MTQHPPQTGPIAPITIRPRHRLVAALLGAVVLLGITIVLATSAPGATVDRVLTSANSAGFTVPAGQVWAFDPNVSTTITVTGNVIVNGTLEMKPANGNVIHTLRFTGIDESDFVGGGMSPIASDVGLWVMGAGTLDLEGESKPAWAHSWQSAWRSTDEVIAAPNTPNDFTFRRINSASVPAKNALGYNTELLNLTRNVRVEGTTSGYTHVFIRSTKPSSIRNAAFRYVAPDPANLPGDTAGTGRYGLHIHMCGNGSRGMIVDGLVIRDTKGNAFVPHASHGVTFRNVIAYNVKGEAFWWDEPPSIGDTTNDSNDIVVDRAVVADVRGASEGSHHRLGAYFLGAGRNLTITNSVAVGVRRQGAADRSGFHWPEHAKGTWVFRNNRAHNTEVNGIFVWQNTSMPHVVESFTAYYNARIGVDHGAYNNAYVYKNLVLLNNGLAVNSLALGNANSSTDTQVWDGVKTNGAVLSIGGHTLEGEKPVRFRNCDFGRVRVEDDEGNWPSKYDFINCGLEPSDFDLANAKSNSVFRVQRANGTAFRITGNGAVTNISAFASPSSPNGPDEMFFYRDDGLYAFYRVGTNGVLGTKLASGTGYTKNMTEITAVDLDGDGRDEMFFYRDDGLYAFYDVRPDGSLGAKLSGGTGYTKDFASITAIDLNGDNKDEMFFYRDDGLYAFYRVGTNGVLGTKLASGTGYTKNMTEITGIELGN